MQDAVDFLRTECGIVHTGEVNACRIEEILDV